MRRYLLIAGWLLVWAALVLMAQQPGQWRPYSGGTPGTPTLWSVLKGPYYTPGHVAVINAGGTLDGVSGASGTDCVHVDGTSGACGSAGGTLPAFHDAETPAGSVNGSNTAFTLAQSPNPTASLMLVRNGIVLRQGADYTLAGSAVTFYSGSQPQTGDILQCWYRAIQ